MIPSLRRHGFAITATLLSLGTLHPSVVAADVYAMVIGIDDYQHIPRLRGAVNDAVDIASALGNLNPDELVLLINEQATRDRIMDTWRSFSEKAEAGDTIIVTYAGHGSNEEAAFPETEPDGKDENFLLAAYAPQGAAAAHRIRDDEIAALIALRPDVSHIIVADSCHSGTATRNTIPGASYRFYDSDGILNDPLPPPPAPAEAWVIGENSLSNSIVFSAVGDAEKVPEVGIDGKMRGALSYAFAQGIRGKADRDKDGTLTKGELEEHIRRFIKSAVNGRQRPQVSPPGQVARALMRVPTIAAAEGSPVAFGIPWPDLPKIPLFITGSENAFQTYATLSGIEQATAAPDEGLTVDFTKREIRDGKGDVLRYLTREVGADPRLQIQDMVDKMRVIRALRDAVVESDVSVSFPYGDELYFNDDPLRLLISGRKSEHVTVLNFPPDGTVQWLYPRYAPLDRSASFDDPQALDPNRELSFDAWVTPPFGAEHIVVIQTWDAHPAVRRAAARFDGLPYIREFWEEMVLLLAEVPHEVGVHAFYTLDAKPPEME